MTESRFCTKCGSSLKADAQFCTKCGQTVAGGAPVESPHPTSVAGAMRYAQTGMAVAGIAGALPWKTIVAGERPDLSQWMRAGSPIAHMAVRKSVRKPALALLFTTLIDAGVSVLSGSPAAMAASGLRLATGLGTSIVGLIVGKKGGWGRKLMGVGSMVMSVFQLYSVGRIVISVVTTGGTFWQLAPSIVSAISVLVVCVKTILMTFRRASAKGAAR